MGEEREITMGEVGGERRRRSRKRGRKKGGKAN